LERIGKSGMGEIFRAKDQKLGRDVTIKALPEEFARDTRLGLVVAMKKVKMQYGERLKHEAKSIAMLNRPRFKNITANQNQ
jgi:serine/threonine protein kinase